jgi:hypothetical protein
VPVEKSQKPPEPVPVESFEDGFKVVRATLRGTTYVLKELPADVYEKCLEGSRDDDGNSDNVILLKLMLDKSLQSPKMTVKQLWELPYPVIRKLNDIINDIHFSFVETEEEEAERESETAGKQPAT